MRPKNLLRCIVAGLALTGDTSPKTTHTWASLTAIWPTNGVTIPERNISTDSDAEQTLIAVGGKRQVPCLFIDGAPLYESGDIIAWVQKNLL